MIPFFPQINQNRQVGLLVDLCKIKINNILKKQNKTTKEKDMTRTTITKTKHNFPQSMCSVHCMTGAVNKLFFF